MFNLILTLQLSLGLGFDMEDDHRPESKDYKGIIQIEKSHGNYDFGYWHSSRLNDGLKGNPDDQNILYIKRNFNF